MKKNLSKLFAMALALIMVMALTVPAFAAQEGDLTGGSITITNAASGETYKAYQILYLESYNPDTGAYAYKANSEWASWLATQTSYVTIDAGGYVSWVDGADPAEFAKAALAYANTMTGEPAHVTINPVATEVAGDNDVVFGDLKLGYYLIDTSLGSLCSLDTTNPNVDIYEKNSTPSVTKAVKEDSTDEYAETATIDVVDTIYYQLTVNTGTNSNGAGTGVDDSYVITDVLPTGITYNTGSVAIADWTLNDDYTVDYEGQTLTITLLAGEGKALSALGQNANVTITYNAAVTGTVKLGHTEGNVNNVTLEYKEQESTGSATVYTYSIGGYAEGEPIFKKVDGTVGENNGKPLEGVKFVLKNDATSKYATFAADGKLTGWVDTKADATALETDENGAIYAYGLDAASYTLEETYTLPGYNLLSGTISAVIAENGIVTYDYSGDETDAANTIVIENKSGAELPSTGGMGTTIFYTLGGVLVVAAGVLLVTKKRMHDMEG